MDSGQKISKARPLTQRQQDVVNVIQGYMEKHGAPPTRAEIANEMGFRSINAAEDHLRALVKKGVILINHGTSRGIRLLGEYAVDNGIPLVGRVAAGNPILAEAHIEDYVNVPASLFPSKADYFLRVHGMSMKDAGILDGDLLAVHRHPTANNGQIVVARIDDEVTVKRFYKNADGVELRPENPDFDVIRLDTAAPLAIEGIGIGVIRQGF